MTAGSALWLLRHELRLAWRAVSGRKRWLVLLVGALLWALVHYGAWTLLSGGPVLQHPLLGAFRLQLAGAVFWLLGSILLAQTIAHTVVALFDRGDLDLLLASPLPPRNVFLIRGLGIAVSALTLPAFLLLPFAHVGAMTGHAGLLGLYALVVAMALLCAGAGMLLTMGLVRAFGTRRARVIAQVLGALFGAGIFLLTQLRSILPEGTRLELLGWLARQVGPGGWLAQDSVLWWPVRAGGGEILPLLACLAVGLLVFGLAVQLAWRRFASGAQDAAAATPARRTSSGAALRPFRGGLLRLLLSKEWKLIRRDPQVISQTLLQMLYLCPMLLLALRKPDRPEFLVPGLVLVTGMLAGNLAWLGVAAEDAPDLLGSAPHSPARMRALKALAAVLPALLLLLPVVLYWLPTRPTFALVLLLCAAGAMFGAGFTQVLNPMRGNRRDLRTRYKQNRLVNLLEVFSVMGWAAMSGLLLSGYLRWAPVCLGLCLLAPAVAWWLGRVQRRGGGY